MLQCPGDAVGEWHVLLLGGLDGPGRQQVAWWCKVVGFHVLMHTCGCIVVISHIHRQHARCNAWVKTPSTAKPSHATGWFWCSPAVVAPSTGIERLVS